MFKVTASLAVTQVKSKSPLQTDKSTSDHEYPKAVKDTINTHVTA